MTPKTATVCILRFHPCTRAWEPSRGQIESSTCLLKKMTSLYLKEESCGYTPSVVSSMSHLLSIEAFGTAYLFEITRFLSCSRYARLAENDQS